MQYLCCAVYPLFRGSGCQKFAQVVAVYTVVVVIQKGDSRRSSVPVYRVKCNDLRSLLPFPPNLKIRSLRAGHCLPRISLIPGIYNLDGTVEFQRFVGAKEQRTSTILDKNSSLGRVRIDPLLFV